MCFSASASFGASAVLGVLSAACFIKASTPAQKVWACIPLFFAVQQTIEGILWLSLLHDHLKALYMPGMYGFLLFAQVIWPALIPIAAFAPERDAQRRKILRYFLLGGAAIAVFHLIILLIFNPHATNAGQHIHYELGQPKLLQTIADSMYFIAAVLPLFASSLKSVRGMGVALVASYALSRIFYQDNIISIWCFFAALMSIIVLRVIHDIGKRVKAISRNASDQAE